MTVNLVHSPQEQTIIPDFTPENTISGRAIRSQEFILAAIVVRAMGPRQASGTTGLGASKTELPNPLYRLNPLKGKSLGKLTPGRSLAPTSSNTPAKS